MERLELSSGRVVEYVVAGPAGGAAATGTEASLMKNIDSIITELAGA